MNRKIFLPTFILIVLFFVIARTVEYTDVDRHTINIPEDSQLSAFSIEEIARGLYVPWSIIFTSPKRILITERNGKIRIIENGILEEKPLYIFKEVSSIEEEGLMGLALDPEYEKNRYFFVSLAYTKSGKMFVKVVRLIDGDTEAKNPTVVIDNIPAAQYHAGSRLRFGPDKKLYITTGDATDKKLAQDLNSLAGKILRINGDGSFPSDNPFSDNAVYSLGHRNPQGLDWHPITWSLFSTEHGPSVFDGPAGGDEINKIEAGKNYGWPIVSHEKSKEGLISPLILFTPAEAPASGMFYEGQMFPELRNNFLFGALKGEAIWIVKFDNNGSISSYEKLLGSSYGRIRDLAEAPDGSIYFSTSNRDGRGRVREGDDKIYRISKK